MAMERIYADYEDKFVKAIKLYADDSNKLYYDVNKTEAVLADDLEMLFVVGVIINVGGATLEKPSKFNIEDKTIVVNDATYTGETVTE